MASFHNVAGDHEGIFAGIVESYFYGDHLVFRFLLHRWHTLSCSYWMYILPHLYSFRVEVLILAHSYAMYQGFFLTVCKHPQHNMMYRRHGEVLIKISYNVSSSWWGFWFLHIHMQCIRFFFQFVNISPVYSIVLVVRFWFLHIHMQCISLFSPAVCEHTPVYHVVIVYSIVVVVRFWFLHIH